MKKILAIVIPVIILIVLFKIGMATLAFAGRIWYITLPLLGYFGWKYFYAKPKEVIEPKENLDPRGEIRADAEIMDDDK